jgi:hypothetical protein
MVHPSVDAVLNVLKDITTLPKGETAKKDTEKKPEEPKKEEPKAASLI